MVITYNRRCTINENRSNHCPGTGDIFSAILIGHLLDGEELIPSTQKAIDGVYKLIDLNKDNKDKNRGIPLEKYLGVL